MYNGNKKIPYRILYILFAVTFIRIAVLYFNNIPLWVDEAQYWFWSKFPDVGYYSKPPVIAWIIAVSTKLLGDSEFAVRFFSPIIHAVTAFYVYLIGSKIYNEKIGFYSAISYIFLPAVSLSSYFISADAPLMLCWAASLYYFICAIRYQQQSKFSDWLLLAIFLGLGLLSKYTILALGFGFAVYIFSRRFSLLFTSNLWIAVIISFMIFLPNLLWNNKNHFVSFLHTQENILNGTPDNSLLNNFDLFGVLKFFAGQILIFGVIFVAAIFAIFKKVRGEKIVQSEENHAKYLLLVTSIPLFVAGIIFSVISGTQSHWVAPAYVSLSILAIWFLVKKEKLFWIKFSIAMGICAFTVVSLLSISNEKDLVSRIIKRDPFARVNIWYELVDPLKQNIIDNTDAVIASDERKIITPLTYALRNGSYPRIIYKWNEPRSLRDHFDLKFSLLPDYQGKILFVTRSTDEKHLRKFFTKVDLLRDVNDRFRIYLLSR